MQTHVQRARRLQRKALGSLLMFSLSCAVAEGVARIIWWRLEQRAFSQTCRRGEQFLRAPNPINFMMEPDSYYGYQLKAGFSNHGSVINAQRFVQREFVPKERVPGVLRVLALGESATQGDDVETGNFPAYLRRLLPRRVQGYSGIEVINAGVAGWLSDQLALRVERELADYRPDVVICYLGWNDFHNYDPFSEPPRCTCYQHHFGGLFHQQTAHLFKSISLLSSYYRKHQADQLQPVLSGPSASFPPEQVYRFFLGNLDRIVTAFREKAPDVRFALCTLVGRWPHESVAAFQPIGAGRTTWMKQHGLTQEEAAQSLDRFNTLLRLYARDHQMMLLDTAQTFAEVDRSRVQYDMAHMSPEGYELLAETMYEGLRQVGAIPGEPATRLSELLEKYRKASPPGGDSATPDRRF